ncbi:MAG: endonuclease/exonuclease/phosphatase family protein [Clostridia bacterium]|nr:endonuclease/exonuclease/phosphatase family protein [Clostridia bacterium]
MIVLQFNIQHARNFLSGKIDLDALSDAIALLGGEVVCLNEVYGEGPGASFTDQVGTLARKLGYHAYFAPAIDIEGHGPYGNAFLSKYPIVSAKTVPVPTVPRNHPGYFEDRCAFCAEIDAGGKRYTVIGIHFGLQPEEQAECAKTVCRLIDEAASPVILTGDFNVEPDDPVLAPIRARLYDTAAKNGGDAPTYPSDKPRIKIDYIFCSDVLYVKNVSVPDMIVSDHLPVRAEIG